MIKFDYSNQFDSILEFARHQFSTIKPSEWTESNRSMDSSMSRYKGRFSYNITPYTKEIVDCLSQDHPSRIVAIMKGAQVGFSAGVIESGVGWIIAQQPANILFLTGHADLTDEAIVKIDNTIDSCGIRHLIRPSVKRKRGMKTGDTNDKKEFPGGSLVSGSANNHKLLRQRSVMYGFIDDFDAAKQSTKQSGSTRKMIEQRFASYADKMKLFYISTPELRQTSNIEPVYLLGDQRKFHIPCPCCGDMIYLEWSIPIKGNQKEMGGITWKLDESNKLIKESVGYICQSCGGFFNDSNKYELNLHGEWKPTAEPSIEGYYSYHISSLYAPPGMFDWEHYVRQYLEANPPGEKQIESLHKTFVNLCLGEPFEVAGESPKANQLQKNQRPYEIGIIPEKLSIKDGNGKIVFLTCACDLNGIEDDSRLDYEVLAWSESGATYSIDHGSIGTFVPKEGSKKFKEDREHFTYRHHVPKSVWPELDKVLSKIWFTDSGRKMKIFTTAIDTGHYTIHAYTYIDTTNNSFVYGIKGKDADKYIPFGKDLTTFKQAKERPNLYLAEVGYLKDELAEYIKLRWDSGNDEKQPANFMNYPNPSGGKYGFVNFFSHYEAEHRVIEYKNGEGAAAIWVKRNPNSQNHFFDVRIYNMVIRDIILGKIGRELKVKNFTWQEFCNMTIPK